MGLGPKQNRFVAEYLVDLNATQAAVRAGYSPRTAEQQGNRLLRNAQVSRAIQEALVRRQARVEVKADDVLRELMRLALVDIGEAFDSKGHLKPLSEMSVDVRRAISSIETDEVCVPKETDDGVVVDVPLSRVRKVKFWDKTKGLELLGKHLKLFTDKVEHSLDKTLEQLVLESQKKGS